jgi:hypothetical protein
LRRLRGGTRSSYGYGRHALAEISISDWQGHARREAAAILRGGSGHFHDLLPYQMYVELLASAWLQGVEYGAHGTLEGVADAIRQLHEAA